jgi:hypothetical protein
MVWPSPGEGMMRLVLLSALVAVAGLTALLEHRAVASSLTCPMQKARGVSFRDAAAKDVLEVSIGTGPCERATLTIVIRSDLGHIVYSYVAPFKQHVADWYVPDLDKEAHAFVDRLLERGIQSSADLPPWLEPEAYEMKNSAVIDVSREVYEELRAKPRPMLSHPTYYEGWKSVVYDRRIGESVVVVSGGV